MDTTIRKRFPTDVDMDFRTTFLTNKNFDGELYAYLQSISYKSVDMNGNNITVVSKADISKKHIAENVLGRSVKTVTRHLNILIEKEYVKDYNSREYLLPNLESTYLLIPLDTIKFLNNTLKEHVIKIYLYLGKNFMIRKDKFCFTKTELVDMLGISKTNGRSFEMVTDALFCLEQLGLIECAKEKYDGFKEKYYLHHWAENIKRQK